MVIFISLLILTVIIPLTSTNVKGQTYYYYTLSHGAGNTDGSDTGVEEWINTDHALNNDTSYASYTGSGSGPVLQLNEFNFHLPVGVWLDSAILNVWVGAGDVIGGCYVFWEMNNGTGWFGATAFNVPRYAEKTLYSVNVTENYDVDVSQRLNNTNLKVRTDTTDHAYHVYYVEIVIKFHTSEPYFIWETVQTFSGDLETPYWQIVQTFNGNISITLGIFEFNYYNPQDMVIDDNFIFVADTGNHRIIKFNHDGSYIAQIGSLGIGDYEFNKTTSITSDNTYIYVLDGINCRIMKFYASNLTYVDQVGSFGNENNQFWNPRSITTNGTHLFIADTANHRVVKYTNDLIYVSKIGTMGSGNDQFDTPWGIIVDDTYVYVADTLNDRIVKRMASNLSYVSQVGSYGSGIDQFWRPRGMSVDDTHIYIADIYNNRVVQRLKSNLTYVYQYNLENAGPHSVALLDEWVYVVNYNTHSITKFSFINIWQIVQTFNGDLETPYWRTVQTFNGEVDIIIPTWKTVQTVNNNINVDDFYWQTVQIFEGEIAYLSPTKLDYDFMAIIWLIIIFLPALILNSAIPKVGFIVGIGLISLALFFAEIMPLWVMMIMFIGVGLLLWRGDG